MSSFFCRVFINGKRVVVLKSFSIMELCGLLGMTVPKFCFHKRLSVAGNCRMCLVEIEKSPKPVASCAMPVANNMSVFTNSPLIKKSQESILEFILLNHPLDCPVCDQGGECDLQEQSLKFGFDKSRFFGIKRSVVDKNCGCLIKMVMTRCIHCTRCVRFATDIAGVQDFGTINRGLDTEITLYVNKIFNSEISGNIVDICPVGALTSKPYVFNSRAWEISSINNIDLFDSIGSNIRYDLKESEIVRILPRECETINQEWISDKTRHFYDGIKNHRLKHSFLKKKISKNKKLQFKAPTWNNLLGLFTFFFLEVPKIRKKALFINDSFSNLETISGIKTLSKLCGIDVNFGGHLQVFNDEIGKFLFDINKVLSSNFCFLLGVNSRFEGTSFNLKIRKRFKKGLLNVVSLGVPHNLTFKSFFFGVNNLSLISVFKGRTKLSKKIKNISNILFLYGGSLAVRSDSFPLQHFLERSIFYLKKNKINLCFFSTTPNIVGSLLTGSNNVCSPKKSIHYVVGTDIDLNLNQMIKSNSFLTITKTSFKTLLHFSDIIFSCKNIIEQQGSYVNCMGLQQQNKKVVTGPQRSCNTAQVLNYYLFPFSSENTSNKRKNISLDYDFVLDKHMKAKKSRFYVVPYVAVINNFFSTHDILRRSKTLIKCSANYKKNFQNFI